MKNKMIKEWKEFLDKITTEQLVYNLSREEHRLNLATAIVEKLMGDKPAEIWDAGKFVVC